MRSPVIRSMQVRAVRVPMTRPHKTASGTITESPLVLVDVATDDGAVGHSAIFTYMTAALAPTAELLRNLGPLIEGESLEPAALEQKLARKFRLLGPQGLVGMALAAIDMALWDALARWRGLSLVSMLGGAEKALPAYGAVGYDVPDACAREAAGWVEKGFTGVKVKIGHPTIAQDLAVIRAMRRAIGDSVAVMVDYNQCLSPAEAILRLRVLEAEELTWVEEPTLAHDHPGHARIAAESKVPIQCGENWWGTTDLRHALAAHASDYVMLDVMKMGGVTGWLRGAALCEAQAVPVSSHLWPEISAQLLCLTPTAHWLEYADWWNPILAEPLVVENGLAKVAGASGTGIDWDEDAVARYAI